LAVKPTPEGEAYEFATPDGPTANLNTIGLRGRLSEALKSQCGDDDDRVPSFDRRIGRLMPMGCTAWLISEDVFVSAGHCVDEGNQDRYSNGWYVEFDVPNSTSNGRPMPSDPEDQYPVRYGVPAINIHPTRREDWFEFGVGNDWTVGRLLPNVISEHTAGQAQGCWFNLMYGQSLTSIPEVRITGYGRVIPGYGNERVPLILNRAQQTHVGAFLSSESTDFRLLYSVDSEGGNSGGPVIDEQTNFAIGVHTHGGCRSRREANHGMSNEHPMFKAAVERYLGVDPTYQVHSAACAQH